MAFRPGEGLGATVMAKAKAKVRGWVIPEVWDFLNKYPA
jgi:hypothetical protein